MTSNVREVIRLVPVIPELLTRQKVEGLFNFFHPHILISSNILMWGWWGRLKQEITTIAGIQVEIWKEFGATPLIQISEQNIALSQSVKRE